MGTSADWEASAVQLAGLTKQIKARGLLDAVLARCGEVTRAAVRDPFSRKWHPGTVLVEFSEAIVAQTSTEAFREINRDMASASFGPILRPMLQVALALTGRSPATLLARLPQAIESALRNVQVTWAATGATSGVVRFHYPCPIEPETLSAWQGALDFLGELAGQPLRYEQCTVTEDTVEVQLAWS